MGLWLTTFRQPSDHLSLNDGILNPDPVYPTSNPTNRHRLLKMRLRPLNSLSKSSSCTERANVKTLVIPQTTPRRHQPTPHNFDAKDPN